MVAGVCGGLGGESGDRLLDQRLTVACGEVAGGDLVPVGDPAVLVVDDHALRDHGQRPGAAAFGPHRVALLDGALDDPLERAGGAGQPAGAGRGAHLRIESAAGREQPCGEAPLLPEQRPEGDGEPEGDGRGDDRHGGHGTAPIWGGALDWRAASRAAPPQNPKTPKPHYIIIKDILY